MGVLSTLSADLASTVESVGQGVVQVEGRRRGPASGTVWAGDGLIVTANHVLTTDENIRVGTGNGKPMEAELVGRDPTTDLALLRVTNQIKAAPAWTGSEGLRVGHLVLALGRPGRTVRAALGIVSALGESWRTPTGGNIERYLQADMSSYPGFSGGPLATAEGSIVGINTSGLLRDTTVTIPTATVKQVVEELLKRGGFYREIYDLELRDQEEALLQAGQQGEEQAAALSEAASSEGSLASTPEGG